MQSKLSRQISDGLTSQFDSYKTEKPREISLDIQSAPYFACAARPYWTLYVQKGGKKSQTSLNHRPVKQSQLCLSTQITSRGRSLNHVVLQSFPQVPIL